MRLVTALKIQSKPTTRLCLFCSGRQREGIEEFELRTTFWDIIGKAVTIECFRTPLLQSSIYDPYLSKLRNMSLKVISGMDQSDAMIELCGTEWI